MSSHKPKLTKGSEETANILRLYSYRSLGRVAIKIGTESKEWV